MKYKVVTEEFFGSILALKILDEVERIVKNGEYG